MKGKAALITGAGRGIGAAAAKKLAAQGASVVVNYRSNSQSAEEVVREIRERGGSATAIQADISVPEEVRRLVEGVLESYGRVDTLVGNAGVGHVLKPLGQMSWEEFSYQLDGELRAAFELVRAVTPTMIKNGYGRIVFVGSEHSKGPAAPGMAAHGTAKAALAAFAKYVAHEYGPYGITANVVSPGMVETDATADLPPEFKKRVVSMTPVERTGYPEDVAAAISFLAAEDGGFVTGIEVPVTGGFEARTDLRSAGLV